MGAIGQRVLDVMSLLNEPGVAFKFGCDERDCERFIRLAAEKFPGKPYCLVREWTLWDIRVSDVRFKYLAEHSIEPVALYTKFMIEDQTGRVPYGHYQISELLMEMIEPCFFVTRFAVYILLGTGTRKSVLESVVAELDYVY